MEVFDDLISAIQEAVVKAHETSEAQHVRMMNRYFDLNTKEPNTIDIKMPYLDPSKDDIQYKEVKVPEICLIPFNSIKIKKIEVEANVEFKELKSDKHKKSISTRLSGGIGRKSNKAKIKISGEGNDPPEALLKLNDTLIKVLP